MDCKVKYCDIYQYEFTNVCGWEPWERFIGMLEENSLFF